MDEVEIELKSGLKQELSAFEMSTILPKRSGLTCKVWVDDSGEKRSIGHNSLRIKYGPNKDNFVSIPFFEKKERYDYIGKPVKWKPDMKSVSKWINLNYNALISLYCEEDYDIVDFLFEMKSI